MKKEIWPSVINGTVCAPASKSIAQRAIALASLSNGESTIHFPGTSADVQTAINVCKGFGADIYELPDKLIINGGINLPNQALNCGESGLGIRIFSCIAATLSSPVHLTGEGTLTKRPMQYLADTINALGAKCSTSKGYAPITVCGPLLGGFAQIDGSQGSQALSGILMASPLGKSTAIIEVNDLKSIPYIDLTIEMMNTFGVIVENISYRRFTVKGQQQYKPATLNVEGDWSGASFFLVAGAIAGCVEVKNLNPLSKQADRAIIDVLAKAGAKVSVKDKSIIVCKNDLNGFEFDATHCPDLIPPLAALAAHCKGESKIIGANRLIHKESNRATTLKQEFAKLKVELSINGDLIRINGSKPSPATINSHGDHRIAMACAIAGLAGNGNIIINNAEAVAKSYPNFFDDLQALTIKSKV